MSNGSDSVTVSELVLYTTNDGDLYSKHIAPMIQASKKKMMQGTYDHALNLRTWKRIVSIAANKYAKEFSSSGTQGTDIFSRRVQNYVANDLNDEYAKSIASGEW